MRPSIGAFEKSCFADDWRELLRLFLVRRTRQVVENIYAKTDKVSGRKYLELFDGSKNYFPLRIPKTIKFYEKSFMLKSKFKLIQFQKNKNV